MALQIHYVDLRGLRRAGFPGQPAKCKRGSVWRPTGAALVQFVGEQVLGLSALIPDQAHLPRFARHAPGHPTVSPGPFPSATWDERREVCRNKQSLSKLGAL